MMSPDQNDLITRVGPGTKCGALMRHYWHPVALADTRRRSGSSWAANTVPPLVA